MVQFIFLFAVLLPFIEYCDKWTQNRSRDLGGSSPMHEEGNGVKGWQKAQERTITPGLEAISQWMEDAHCIATPGCL
jgi:hypothetical protein